MNFAFVVVVIAAAGGISSELALRAVAPESGPVLALFIMAIALLVAAARVGRAPKREPAPAPSTQSGLHQLPT